MRHYFLPHHTPGVVASDIQSQRDPDYVCVLDAATGQTKWKLKLQSRFYFSTSPVFTDGTVYIRTALCPRLGNKQTEGETALRGRLTHVRNPWCRQRNAIFLTEKRLSVWGAVSSYGAPTTGSSVRPAPCAGFAAYRCNNQRTRRSTPRLPQEDQNNGGEQPINKFDP